MKLTLEAINQAIAVLFFVCYAYQFVYIPVALLRRRKSSAICWIACMPRITICH